MSRERVFEDPLGALFGADATPAAVSQSTGAAVKPPVYGSTAVGALKTLDVSKVHVREAKQAGPAPATAPVTVDDAEEETEATNKTADNRLGLGVSFTFANEGAGPTQDVLASTNSHSTYDGGLFEAHSRLEPESLRDSARPRVMSTLRVMGEKEDDKIDDLVVGRILEREGEVDALFGKSSVTPQGQAQPYPQPLRQTAALDEDLESAELLDELAALTMQSAPKKLGYSPVHAPVQSETAGQDVDDELFGMVTKPVASIAPPPVDMSTLNLEDYIRQHAGK